MDIIRLTYPFTDDLQSVRQAMAIGFFDGVHLGHQEVIRKAIAVANCEQITSSIMTFDPHPREVLGNAKQQHKNIQYITPLSEKLERFAASGLERTYILTFNKTLSELTPEQFIHEVLFALQVDTVIVGFNFTFGHLGRGNVDMLRDIGADRMKVNVIRPFHKDNYKVSSTVIREKLHAGELSKATQLLGRPYSMTGQVVQGFGRGRTIGIPTANVEPRANYVIPCNGVYAVRVLVGGVLHHGVMNVGLKPTFDDHPAKPTLEVHILNFNKSIYGECIEIQWIEYMRAEQKFTSVNLLVEQIQSDLITAEKILLSTP